MTTQKTDVSAYSEKLFEFTNIFHEREEWFDNIRLIQVGETYLNAGATILPHEQQCHEISYVISGKGILDANESSDEYSSGDIQIVSRGVLHNITSDSASKLRFFHFGFNFGENVPKEILDFYDGCKCVKIHDTTKRIKPLLELLIDEYYSNNSFSNRMKNHLVHMIILIVWRLANTENEKYKPNVFPGVHGRLIYNIMHYIESNPSEKLTVEHISKKFSYNMCYLSHLFKKKTGISIKQFIIRSRMEYAKKLLNENRHTLEETAALCGYSSVTSFCKIFKKYTGLTSGKLFRT